MDGIVVHKTFAATVKKLGENVYEFIASTEDVDRDGEVVTASGWDLDNYRKNPVVMFAHDYRSLPIGKAVDIKVRGKKLVSKIEFTPPEVNEFGDAVKRLVEWGALSAVSVGFAPREWTDGEGEKEPKRRYTRQELLEQSIVPVPSNPNALHEAREANVITTKEFEGLTKVEVAKPDTETVTLGHDVGAVQKPEETDNTIRIPVPGEAGKHEGHKIRYITVSDEKGIKGLYCIDDKKVITYVFNKDKWNMERARAWVDEHKGGKGYPVTHEQVADEIDYLIGLIDEVGLNIVNLADLQLLTAKYMEKHQSAAQSAVEIQETPQPRVLTVEEIRVMAAEAIRPILNHALGIVD